MDDCCGRVGCCPLICVMATLMMKHLKFHLFVSGKMRILRNKYCNSWLVVNHLFTFILKDMLSGNGVCMFG